MQLLSLPLPPPLTNTYIHCRNIPVWQMLRLEFAHYDYKSQGTISAKDFALSMVASADMKHINKFLDRVDELESEPQLKDIHITFDEFKNLAELRKSLRPLSLAIFSYGKVNGLLTKQDFQRASYHVLSGYSCSAISFFTNSLIRSNDCLTCNVLTMFLRDIRFVALLSQIMWLI